VARGFAAVLLETMHAVAECVSKGDLSSAFTPEEQKVCALLKQVNSVSAHVLGSGSSKTVMHNQIHALMIDQGLSNFYITINPADVYNSVIKFLAGDEINVDYLLPADVPEHWKQSILVAHNPIMAARFFDLYMKAFFSAILGFNNDGKKDVEGVLGMVKAYYGCVEAQGHGTLHCH